MSNDHVATTKKAGLPSSVYDTLKWASLVALPALGTLYFSLAGVWGLPAAEQVVSTVIAVETALGILLGISHVQYNKSDSRFDGTLVVDQSDPETDHWSFEVDDLENLPNKNAVTLKVATPPSQ